jgi:hypothetical protein
MNSLSHLFKRAYPFSQIPTTGETHSVVGSISPEIWAHSERLRGSSDEAFSAW